MYIYIEMKPYSCCCCCCREFRWKSVKTWFHYVMEVKDEWLVRLKHTFIFNLYLISYIIIHIAIFVFGHRHQIHIFLLNEVQTRHGLTHITIFILYVETDPKQTASYSPSYCYALANWRRTWFFHFPLQILGCKNMFVSPNIIFWDIFFPIFSS